MSGGGKARNNRAYNMALSGGCALVVVAIEVWFLFRHQWVLFDALMKENPYFTMGSVRS